MTLACKVALITGCASPRGIGRACAIALAREGSVVAVTDIAGPLETEDGSQERAQLLDTLVDEITTTGGRAHARCLDVSDADDIARTVEELTDTLGTPDILVNNAGTVTGAGPFLQSTPDQWRASFAVNLLGPMMMAQAVIPGMIAKGDGRIINMGSIGGLGGRPAFGAYSAMKHGITGLTKTIAAEFGPQGIRCNAVCPGYIATDMHEASNIRLAEAEGLPLDTMKRRRYEAVALRAAGRPEDIAAAVTYLAGPQGAYVSGINLPVAGGIQLGL